MAVAELVAYTDDGAVSADTTVASGAAVVLLPFFPGKPGFVSVEYIHADDSGSHLATIRKPFRLEGPAEFRVRVKHAGCDIIT